MSLDGKNRMPGAEVYAGPGSNRASPERLNVAPPILRKCMVRP